MNKELKEVALRIFCAKANLLLVDNEANLRYNKGLAESSINYAKLFLEACKGDKDALLDSPNKPNQ